jgi:hypothetical protein
VNVTARAIQIALDTTKLSKRLVVIYTYSCILQEKNKKNSKVYDRLMLLVGW